MNVLVANPGADLCYSLFAALFSKTFLSHPPFKYPRSAPGKPRNFFKFFRYAFAPFIDVGEDDDDDMTLSDAFRKSVYGQIGVYIDMGYEQIGVYIDMGYEQIGVYIDMSK